MKKILPSVVLFTIVASFALFLYVFVYAMWYVPETELEVPDKHGYTSVGRGASQSLQGDYPVRVKIPSLDIVADVEAVGVNWKGNMASPSTYHEVGWYKKGTRPGEVGSAVIDGHVDNGLGLNGAFKHLEDIAVGDDVLVDMKSGERLRFVVVEKAIYPYLEVPVDTLFSRADAARLNLVTCDGRWVRGGDTYDHRLVVYTQLEA